MVIQMKSVSEFVNIKRMNIITTRDKIIFSIIDIVLSITLYVLSLYIILNIFNYIIMLICAFLMLICNIQYKLTDRISYFVFMKVRNYECQD